MTKTARIAEARTALKAAKLTYKHTIAALPLASGARLNALMSCARREAAEIAAAYTALKAAKA